MSVFIAPKLQLHKPAKVHYSQYIRTENKPEEEPAESPQPSESPKPDTQ